MLPTDQNYIKRILLEMLVDYKWKQLMEVQVRAHDFKDAIIATLPVSFLEVLTRAEVYL